MAQESEVREKLLDVLQGDLPLEEFADWLSTIQRDVHRSGTPATQDLVAAISLLMYEFFGGHLREPLLLEELSGIARDVRVEWALGAVSPRTLSSANMIISQQREPVLA